MHHWWLLKRSGLPSSGDSDGREEEDEREWCRGRYGGGRRRWKRKGENDDVVVCQCFHVGAVAVVHWTMGENRGATDVVL
ncbi:hypothetical protein HAX54_043825 [Datura stramonium]|uniref:Uncharacterized protein n=1 Tax=Datura stramonium TaxID=4076 RepID=A0ABS8SNK8_DATST|nr:hypothetical protein [Datura stramonium]